MKIWGRARVIEQDDALVERLLMPKYRARPEHAVLFTVEAWDVNCRQHIPRKLDAEDVEAALATLRDRIVELEKENARLRDHGTPSAALALPRVRRPDGS